ncbi:MAG: hypothetical protein JWN28_838 [Candidatus Saccharibacteria bacterium]|nr:hypothetical protein [Candidatus Saccharibacteria bacterium]
MATDEKNNYWEQTLDEQPLDGQQPSVNAEPEPLQPDESSVAQSPVVEDTPDNPPITWTAQEYVHLDKGTGWFVLFVLIVLGLVAIDIFLLKSWTFSALVVVMAVAIIIYIRRPPRTLTYALSPTQGLYVGEQLYHFDEFKAFGIIKDGDDHSIMLIPRKRFSPGVSVFFPEEAGERIVDILGQRLPIEELKLDIVDLVVRKLRL